MVQHPSLLLLFLTVSQCAAGRHVATSAGQSTKNGWNCSSIDTSDTDYDIVDHDSWSTSSFYYNYDTPPPKCTAADENTHGTYSSSLSPCEISFHNSDVPDDGNNFNLLIPEACTADNRVALSSANTKRIMQQINNWKDECVGDFTRCYSLANDQRILLSLVCNNKNWKIPPEATHMSVNCTKDKLLILDSVEKQKSEQDKELKEVERLWHQLVALVATVLAVLVASLVGCCAFSYFCMVKPYLAMSRDVTHSEIKDLMHRSNQTGTLTEAEIA